MVSGISAKSTVTAIGKRLGSFSALLAFVVLLSANNKCQEDYYFGTQSDTDSLLTPSGSPTASPTATEDPDETDPPDDTETPTPSGSAVGTATPTRTATRTASEAQAAFMLLEGLEAASGSEGERDLHGRTTPSPRAGGRFVAGAEAQGELSDNWLGKLYGGGEDGAPPVWVVGDGVGYQRSVVALLKGLDVAARSVTSGAGLEEVKAGTGIVVLEAESQQLPPCRVVRGLGQSLHYIVVNNGSLSQGVLLCDGHPVGEVVASPVNRIALRRALERAADRVGNGK